MKETLSGNERTCRTWCLPVGRRRPPPKLTRWPLQAPTKEFIFHFSQHNLHLPKCCIWLQDSSSEGVCQAGDVVSVHADTGLDISASLIITGETKTWFELKKTKTNEHGHLKNNNNTFIVLWIHLWQCRTTSFCKIVLACLFCWGQWVYSQSSCTSMRPCRRSPDTRTSIFKPGGRLPLRLRVCRCAVCWCAQEWRLGDVEMATWLDALLQMNHRLWCVSRDELCTLLRDLSSPPPLLSTCPLSSVSLLSVLAHLKTSSLPPPTPPHATFHFVHMERKMFWLHVAAASSVENLSWGRSLPSFSCSCANRG